MFLEDVGNGSGVVVVAAVVLLVDDNTITLI